MTESRGRPTRAREEDEEATLSDLATGIVAEEDEAHGEDEDEPAEAPTPEALEAVPGLGGSEGEPPLREVVKRYGAAPLLVLFALNMVDEFDRIAFSVLAPDIQDTFALSDTAISTIAALGGVLTVLAAIPFAILGDRRRRTLIAGITGLVWAGFAFVTGLVRATWQLGATRVGAGLAKASVEPVHNGLLSDYYPVHTRGRVFAAHRAANPAAGVLGPITAGGIAALAGGAAGWRWAFILMAPLSVIAAISAWVLREPRRGGQERRTIGLTDEDETSAVDGEAEGDEGPPIPVATGFRRLLAIRSLRYMFFGIGVLGFGIFGAQTLISLYFEEIWGVGNFGRGVIFTILAIGPLLGLPVGGVVGDRLFRRDPAWPLFAIGASIPAYGLVTAGALWLPQLWLVVAVFVAAQAAVQLGVAPFQQMVAATAPPKLRSLAFGSVSIFTVFFGGFLGAVIFGSISDATNPRVALSLLWIPSLVAGLLIVYGSRFVKEDIGMVVEDIREERRAAERRRTRQRNLLEVRNLDFSYGPVQVLFGVDLDVEEGEILALLGTNGAGKSTLLRAITGLDHPTRGSVRFDGFDITYLETEQLLGLGIAQMPGGKAIFPGLTVEENLKVGTFSFRQDARRVREEIEQVESWFPVLWERRSQLAATLSGGEQQMLALGKAFLTRPRLMCIDELSLGLAPSITSKLLEIVREMHRRGTTILIVEQSLNVALSLASRAVFMEKGAVRFSGSADELLDRPDLARAVFLGEDGG